MTDSTTSSVPTPENKPQEEKGQTSGNTPAPASRPYGLSLVLSSVALLVSLAAAGGLYLQYQQNKTLLSNNNTLQSEFGQLQSQLTQANRNLSEQMASQVRQLDSSDALRRDQQQALSEIQSKLATLSRQDNKSWLLAQADFLVKLAGRKLWSEHDILSAALLLKNADESLTELNDPSLIEVRRLLTEDISTLGAIHRIDSDGLVLQLTQLSTEVDKLPRRQQKSLTAQVEQSAAPENADRLQRWQHNLQQSWQHFLSSFVTIRQRQEGDESWMRPEQIEYLQENIRTQLLLAAQAVPREQEQQYRQSLDTVINWVNGHFDTASPLTRQFLQKIEQLRQQEIKLQLPQQLKSQAPLERLTRNRLFNMMPATSGSAQQEE
ncbi:MAG: uroporphyrinogen-III C-methyltransferase [Enterobacteriaceae bacterium]